MTSHERAKLTAIEAILKPAGFQVEFHRAKRHAAAVITAPDGSRHKITLAGSGRAGDHEAATYGRQEARQLLRRYQPETPWTKEDYRLRSFYVDKINSRLVVICQEDRQIIYKVPDALAHKIPTRAVLKSLAERLEQAPEHKYDRLIEKFERSLAA
ncbi:hypothetical protein KIKIMORA_01120 [Brevundimonas phage vB_BpoS-Kikimora]|uniref:Uncharacterized protein n=1 Tax=Brevundimonas phage vB_BpoS-Kikimora TaxID=2948601 RepID=A0A9E7MRF0_9CAUD|nr:hypothetical protein KIKIMORA_01120 [Brevundimonas phage vB_BpoS-Kikimora]